MPYSTLNPRTELEQQVSSDLKVALTPRGASVTHYGTSAAHAPATAPCDISIERGKGSARLAIMVEVAQRLDATEFQSIVSHLDTWANSKPGHVNMLYAGRSTSARMARLIRNENERRENNDLKGRIVCLKLDDLEAFIDRWKGLPASEVPVSALDNIFIRWRDCKDDLASALVVREVLFPTWQEKQIALENEASKRLTLEQERLKKDIVTLENKLRERGVTGSRAHKYLIYLFFMALFEDKRGMATRATVGGFMKYKAAMPAADKSDPEFRDRTVHHLMVKEILVHSDVHMAGIGSQYEPIELADDFVLERVIPVFEKYSFADASIDAIGAVFEALARRAEKDNRIGQFFTPPTAVAATCRLAGIRPTDIVLDPACGTARFLIHAMDLMLKRAGEVTGIDPSIVEKKIRTEQLLGCDLDSWVSVIGKMNMYIHGDGKSNIRQGNGLTLAARPAFAPQIAGPLVNLIDVIPTNPPLGDIDFDSVAKDVGFLLAGPDAKASEIEEKARHWSSQAFEVIPHRIKEEEDRDRANTKVAEYAVKVVALEAEGEVKKALRAKASLAEWQQKANVASAAIGAKTVTPIAAGRTAKGGVLFISALVKVLKTVRDPGMPVEWKGGVLSLVIDEAVLNTREYADAREFIRRNFFLKAVVSLPRDAFEDLAKTTAKTSIVFLIRKENTEIQQREQVFFSHATRIGPSSSDLLRPNDLDTVCNAYDAWRSALIEGCRKDNTPVPEASRVHEALSAAKIILNSSDDFAGFESWNLTPTLPRERLDVAYWRMKSAIAALPKTVPLSDLTDLVRSGRTPPAADFYRFAFVSRLTAIVSFKGETDTSYAPEDLQQIRTNDVLVSGIDLVNGSIGVVGPECDGMVVSKEYLILQAKNGIDAHWLVAMLRTSVVRRIIEGTVTGTSNRTRVESPDALMALRVPPALPVSDQNAVGDLLRSSHDHQRAAIEAIQQAEAKALPSI